MRLAMKILTFILLGFFLFLDCSGMDQKIIVKNRPYLVKKLRLAVLDFTDAPGKHNSGSYLADALARNALKMPQWQIVERSQVQKILLEKKYNLAGITGKDSLEIGQLLGADILVFGNVHKFQKNDGIIDRRSILMVDYRFVDINTGELLLGGQYRDEESISTLSCVLMIAYWPVGLVHYLVTDPKDEYELLNDMGENIIKEISSRLDQDLLEE